MLRSVVTKLLTIIPTRGNVTVKFEATLLKLLFKFYFWLLNGREPKSCLSQVFNFKLGSFAQ
jgi:hypothetical protein